ncbi:hypothetical protein L1987_53009 [Smallanthus sonchifolius]|uniref:Uncharacterized protein n=1 Tax=Smallanthus sonchifolius TaxID=185202 RepID=A0ACB9EVC6_9ASTR|nr:hypothetical protein L1987_53009 [Smallanthus sonchifolius]
MWYWYIDPVTGEAVMIEMDSLKEIIRVFDEIVFINFSANDVEVLVNKNCLHTDEWTNLLATKYDKLVKFCLSYKSKALWIELKLLLLSISVLIGPLAYQLELLDEMNGVHDVSHVLYPRKCLADEYLVMPLQDVEVDEKIRFVEQPLQIEDSHEKRLKRKKLTILKVKWNSRRGPEYTLELESEIRKKYPHMFE